MSDGAVVVTCEASVAVIRINRPLSRNALTAEVKAGLAEHVPALLNDATVGCIVLTGTDGAFCSGGDIAAMEDRRAPAVRLRLQASHEWVRQLLTAETPVIAAVNGPAAGAGFSLAMLCDIVLMSTAAFMQAGFPAIGAVPDLGLAWTLPRAIGMARAREVLLSNRRIDAAEAVALGIAAHAHPPADLFAAAMTMAGSIAAGPRLSLGLTKSLLAGAYGPIDQFLQEEALAQAVAFGSEDFDEGVRAFLAKRRPAFGSPAEPGR